MLEGDISEIRLIDRLVELWRDTFTGAIRFENEGIIKIVYFKAGDILSASTNDRADSVDEILMRAGKVSREHVKQALAKRKESETLGDALLNLGFITRKELTWARRVQVVGVIRSIEGWTTGSFTIVEDYLPKRDEGTLFSLPQIIVELIVTDQDRARFERAMDGGSAVFEKGVDFYDVFRRLGLNEDAEAIAAEVDGERSASEIAAASGRDTFNAYKLLHALSVLGILRRAETPTAKEADLALDDDLASAGVADAADMWGTEVDETLIQPTQTYDLDEADTFQQPTIELPVTSVPEPETEAPPIAPATSAWDEPEEDESFAAANAPTGAMPAWDVPPAAAAAPIPVPVPPPAEAAEEQWGFDEAQIETARRASVPMSSTEARMAAPLLRGKQKKSSRRGVVGTVVAVLILAIAAYGGFLWWSRQQAPVVEAKAPAPVKLKRTTPPDTGTIVPVTESTTSAATSTLLTTTTTVPPNTTTTASAPLTVTATSTPASASAAPAPVTASAPPAPVAPAPAPVARALPPVTPSPKGSDALRAQYDAMARQYAAAPSGNFTVQIQILCEASNLTKAIRDGAGSVWFVPQPIGTRSCYRVLWGHFATRDEAQRAMAQIPASLRDPSAAVKPVPRG